MEYREIFVDMLTELSVRNEVNAIIKVQTCLKHILCSPRISGGVVTVQDKPSMMTRTDQEQDNDAI